MMYIFLTSFSLLACSFVLRVTEEVHSVRLMRGARKAIDVQFLRARNAVGDVFHTGCEYTHRELFARVLHMLIYGTLFLTRKMERGLENSMMWLRSLRRKSRARRIEREKRKLEEQQ